jgi:hypothetical protein
MSYGNSDHIDPELVISQIGAVELGLDGDFPIIDTFKASKHTFSRSIDLATGMRSILFFKAYRYH